VNFTDPPQYFTFATFDFDEAALGFRPNVFGFVWTDGPSNASIAIELRTKDNVRIEYVATEPYFASGLGDGDFHGETNDDTFFGVIVPRGIERVSIINLSHTDEIGGFELDHVQYGLVVPEPSTMACAATAILTCLISRQPRRGLERLDEVALTVNTHLFF
jgi:hypothetical protein